MAAPSPYNTLYAGSTPGPTGPQSRRRAFPSSPSSEPLNNWMLIDRRVPSPWTPRVNLAGLRAELEAEELREKQRWAQRQTEQEWARRALAKLEAAAGVVRCARDCRCLHCKTQRVKTAVRTFFLAIWTWISANIATVKNRYIAPVLHQLAEIRDTVRFDILPPVKAWMSWFVEQFIVGVLVGIFVVPLARIAYLKFTRTFYEGWFDDFKEALYSA